MPNNLRAASSRVDQLVAVESVRRNGASIRSPRASLRELHKGSGFMSDQPTISRSPVRCPSGIHRRYRRCVGTWRRDARLVARRAAAALLLLSKEGDDRFSIVV